MVKERGEILVGINLYFSGDCNSRMGERLRRTQYLRRYFVAIHLGGWGSMKKRIALGLCLLLSLPVAAAQGILKIPKPQSNIDVLQDYYTGLLRRALINGANGREVPALQETTLMEQGRAAYELNRGALADVFWMGTNSLREQQLRAIRIPLARGLIGYRRFIIRTDRRARFDAITRFDELKKQIACQGLAWPDVDILRAAGMKVTVSPGFEGLYQQLVAKRCDYFPRGYFEAGPELEKRQQLYPQLQRYDSLVLHYPFAIYFFVQKDNEELALWIERGLEQMIDTGEFLTYMKNHSLTSHVFPLNKTASPRRIIHIPNPFLPADTNYSNTRYWFQPSDFE